MKEGFFVVFILQIGQLKVKLVKLLSSDQIASNYNTWLLLSGF